MKQIFLTLALLCFTAIAFAQTQTSTSASTETTTVSINDSNRDYSIMAGFSQPKMASLKSLISDALGKPDHDEKGLILWNSRNTYTVTLKARKLMIELDKEKATGTLYKTFERLGEQVQRALGTPRPPATP